MIMFKLLDFALELYELGLFAYILCSWIMYPAAFSIRRWLAAAYEPLLAPIRRWIPSPRIDALTIDLSPIVLLVALGLFRRMLFALFV